jgi:hypothetical protein
VRSAYPNWDREDRDADGRRLERGELVLAEGHETGASTVRDGRLDAVLEMPSESPWPLVLALAVALMFVMFLTSHYVVGAIFVGLAGCALGAWHLREPQEAT